MSKALPPAAVSLDLAKIQLRLEGDEAVALEPLLTLWLKAITQEAEHITGRAFVNRPAQVVLDAFPDAIRLSAPTYSVESVTYLDADGVQQTLDPADYYVDKVTEPGYIVPASGKAWPVTAARVNAATVNYTAGYGLDDSTVPEAAKLYIIARISEQWDPVVKGMVETAQSAFVMRILDSLKVYA